ncbi:MAG: hypothetical protein IJE47_09580 [Bacteroidales bacterium]|nr:hypothetical protein [Bacteroidales bacterium]
MKKLLVLACVLLVMVSCKKDEETNLPQTKAPVTENRMSETESKVVSFLDMIKKHENGEKSNETMSYDDAVILWENTLNYCHSFTSLPKSDIQLDTIYMRVKGVNGETINASDAVNAYNTLVEEVREVYSNIDITDKKLHYVMVDDNEESASKDGGDEVRVVIITGKETQREDPPFTTVPWYGVPFTDDYTYHAAFAAINLTRAVQDYDYAHMLYYTPGPNMYTYVHSYQWQYGYDIHNCDWVYNGANDSIMSANTMNQLYADIMINTHTENMIINDYYNYSYYETIISNRTDVESMSHKVDVYYAVREWREKGIEIGPGVEYPVDITLSN